MRVFSQRTLGTGDRIRVLVVDDSVVVRQLLNRALDEDPLLEVVGLAKNGKIALELIPLARPDVVTLDIEMPEMDGLGTLRRIRLDHPQIRTIMFSASTTRGASATLEALSLGADDYVTKTSHAGSLDQSMATLRREMVPRIKQFFRHSLDPQTPPDSNWAAPTAGTRSGASRPGVLAIAISTGGPAALADLIPRLPAGFPLPALIVQHMPPLFTRLLAGRLQIGTPLEVVEAAEGMTVAPGRIVIARGGSHLQVRQEKSRVVCHLDDGDPENSCRPAADVLFRSVAAVYGSSVLCAVLTGMGHDGLAGVRVLKSAGAFCIAQDAASSVVWGMPGAVVQAGLADRVVSLDQMVPEILRQIAI